MAMNTETPPFGHKIANLIRRARIKHVLQDIVGFYIDRHALTAFQAKLYDSAGSSVNASLLPKNTTSPPANVVSLL